MLLYIATAFAGTRQITSGGTTTQQNALESCYEQWEGHPFAEPSKQEFTYIEPIIRVMGFGSADHLHVLVEAKKLAFEDRARWHADPAAAEIPVAELISKDYARERRKLIDMERAAPSTAAMGMK